MFLQYSRISEMGQVPPARLAVPSKAVSSWSSSFWTCLQKALQTSLSVMTFRPSTRRLLAISGHLNLNLMARGIMSTLSQVLDNFVTEGSRMLATRSRTCTSVRTLSTSAILIHRRPKYSYSRRAMASSCRVQRECRIAGLMDLHIWYSYSLENPSISQEMNYQLGPQHLTYSRICWREGQSSALLVRVFRSFIELCGAWLNCRRASLNNLKAFSLEQLVLAPRITARQLNRSLSQLKLTGVLDSARRRQIQSSLQGGSQGQQRRRSQASSGRGLAFCSTLWKVRTVCPREEIVSSCWALMTETTLEVGAGSLPQNPREENSRVLDLGPTLSRSDDQSNSSTTSIFSQRRRQRVSAWPISLLQTSCSCRLASSCCLSNKNRPLVDSQSPSLAGSTNSISDQGSIPQSMPVHPLRQRLQQALAAFAPDRKKAFKELLSEIDGLSPRSQLEAKEASHVLFITLEKQLQKHDQATYAFLNQLFNRVATPIIKDFAGEFVPRLLIHYLEQRLKALPSLKLIQALLRTLCSKLAPSRNLTLFTKTADFHGLFEVLLGAFSHSAKNASSQSIDCFLRLVDRYCKDNFELDLQGAQKLIVCLYQVLTYREQAQGPSIAQQLLHKAIRVGQPRLIHLSMCLVSLLQP